MVFAIGTLQDELEGMREFYAVYGACMESSEAYLREDWVATPLSLMVWYWSEQGMYGKGIYSISYYLKPVQYAVAVALIIPGATSYNVLNHAFPYPPLSAKFSPKEGEAYLRLYRFIEVIIEVKYVAWALATIRGEVVWMNAMYLTRKYKTWEFVQPASVVV
jgi:hypothetical protein